MIDCNLAIPVLSLIDIFHFILELYLFICAHFSFPDNMDERKSTLPAGSSSDKNDQHAVEMGQVREHGKGRRPDRLNRFEMLFNIVIYFFFLR